jgi:hypothetical protein
MKCALLAAGMLFAVGAATTGTAFAGTYPVTACAGTTPLINDSWQAFNNNTAYLQTPANCGSNDITEGSLTTSGLAAADVLKLSTDVPAGATAGWRFTAPVGDTISAISINRDLYRQAEGWVPQIVNAEGKPLPGETCSFNGDCEVSGEAIRTGLDTTSLAIELVCDPAPVQLTACANGFSQHDARVELNSASVTVTDEQPPQITSTSGSLFIGGLVSGVLSGTIDGSDNSGVQYARMYVDGALVAEQSLACDFTQPAPCPASSSNQFSLDTTALTNGPHQVQAAVVDAAGNQTLDSPIQVTVDNAGLGAPSGGASSIGPGSLASVRGPINGTNASDQAKLTARWKSTAKTTRTSGYGAVDRVNGRLTTFTGQAISGASLDVYERPAYQGAKTVSLPGVRTGPTGEWALTLPRDSSSSALRFAYRSHVDDTIPVATAALALRVHAGIALGIAPHVTSVGRSIFFSGTLHGAPIPPGKQLVIEASSGGEWIQFDTISTGAKGRYRASYRFKFPGPVTYRFRVLSPYEADFPFLDGASNVVDVHER